MAKDRGGKKAGKTPSAIGTTLKGAAPGLVKQTHGKQAQQAAKPQKRTVDFKAASNGGSFLQARLGKKVRELRSDGSALNAVAPAVAHSFPQELIAIQEDAKQRAGDFERQTMQDAVDDFAGGFAMNPQREAENTRRRFWSELRKVLANADIIIEVLDARDPASCRSEELEREVSNAGKRLVLLLNKVDLVPRTAAQAWVAHLRRSFPTIAFKSARSGAQRAKHAMTSLENAPEGLLRSTNGVVGADELMQLLKNYSRTGGGQTKAHVSVGIVGYPNCGKSSVINSMKRYAAVEVGGRAGVTKIMQEVKLDSKVTMIDSPGVVFAGSSEDPAVVLRNVVRPENVDDPIGVIEALVIKAPRQALLQYYGFSQDFATATEFLTYVAQTGGKLKRGGGLELASAARSVIADWTAGKIRYYVLPPDCSQDVAKAVEAESAQVVTALAPDFDIDALFSGGGESPVVLGAPVQDASGDADMDDGSNTVHVDMDGMFS
mmetsp:Transcript_33279/g.75845  ORF Transcript_33279/g.75845 Transcript_33279/m.75845 type:complete len:491 (-) Transcript_33279:38-1510(-)